MLLPNSAGFSPTKQCLSNDQRRSNVNNLSIKTMSTSWKWFSSQHKQIQEGTWSAGYCDFTKSIVFETSAIFCSPHWSQFMLCRWRNIFEFKWSLCRLTPHFMIPKMSPYSVISMKPVDLFIYFHGKRRDIHEILCLFLFYNETNGVPLNKLYTINITIVKSNTSVTMQWYRWKTWREWEIVQDMY